MPSLPELEVYKRKFSSEIVGQSIVRVEPLDFRVVRADAETLEGLLVDHAITTIDRYGKWLALGTGAPGQLIIHLGLTGKLRLLSPEDENPRYSAFALHFDDGRRLVMSDQRHLGKIYVRAFDELKTEKQLGPDQLDISEDNFVAALAGQHRAVRDVLMDQHLIAGIGGKYADEMLWQAKIHPNAKSGALAKDQLAGLYRLVQDITKTAISLDADVERFPPVWLIPHRRTDKVCPRCDTALTERSLGGSAAVYCPHCQPAPSPQV